MAALGASCPYIFHEMGSMAECSVSFFSTVERPNCPCWEKDRSWGHTIHSYMGAWEATLATNQVPQRQEGLRPWYMSALIRGPAWLSGSQQMVCRNLYQPGVAQENVPALPALPHLSLVGWLLKAELTNCLLNPWSLKENVLPCPSHS